MKESEKASEPLLSERSEQKSIKEEINVRHQHESASDKVDGTTANEVESEAVHIIHSVTELQDSTDEAPTHGTYKELIPTLGHSPDGNSEDDINLTLVISDENIYTGKQRQQKNPSIRPYLSFNRCAILTPLFSTIYT